MRCIYCFIVFLSPVLLSAQTEFGIKAGTFDARFRYFTDDEYFLNSDKIKRLEVGIFATIKIGKKLFIEPEINFLEKGGKTPTATGSSPATTIMRQVELVVPLMYQYAQKGFFVFVKGGASYGHFVSGYKETPITGRKELEFDNFHLRRPDLGFLVGGGIGVLLQKSRFFVESRYRQSILYTSDVNLEDFKFSTKNRGWGIYLCYAKSFSKG